MNPDPSGLNLKNTAEIVKNCVEILGFLFAGLYFLYRLLAGFFIPCRLSVELTCDTPFTDKNLVKCNLKLKNTGQASVRVYDTRLWAYRLDPESFRKKGGKPFWPASREKALRLDKLAAELKHELLDFQRLSYEGEPAQLTRRQAREEHGWLNLETQGEQQRQFVFRLEPGYYKIEFRLIGGPMFGRDTQFFRSITNRLFPLSRYSQWVATAVVEVSSPNWWRNWTDE